MKYPVPGYVKLKSMKNIFCFFAFGIICICFSNGCRKDKSAVSLPGKITGSAQKGPFLNGSSITLYELDSSYSQTGRTFYRQITNNAGSFELDGLALTSAHLLIRADGFYFNEVCGTNSASQITLHCISTISENPNSLHINILTELEVPRVEYLLSSGILFDSAKVQAQSEVLNIFNISSSGMLHSEELDISNPGDGNAILLAVSSIMQGFRTESELALLSATINNDIRTDGVLDDNNIKSSLIDHALLLDTISIRNNITNYYLNVGITPSIPHFETYIRQFIDNTTFIPTNSVIHYPATGAYGDNLLDKSKLVYNGYVSLKADLKQCLHLKIRVSWLSGSWIGVGGFNVNWSQIYDPGSEVWIFTIVDPTISSDNIISTSGNSTIRVEYFENNDSTPTFSKVVTIYH